MDSDSSKWCIRGFQVKDCEPLAQLFFNTIRTINLKDYTQEQVEAWAPDNRDMEQWKSSFEGKFVFVVEDRNGPAGFGELEPDGHIDRFYVDARSVGKGAGKAIYAAIEAKAIALNISELFVEASITAKPFFLRNGFQLLHEQTVMRNGVALNNFVMRKILPPSFS